MRDQSFDPIHVASIEFPFAQNFLDLLSVLQISSFNVFLTVKALAVERS